MLTMQMSMYRRRPDNCLQSRGQPVGVSHSGYKITSQLRAVQKQLPGASNTDEVRVIGLQSLGEDGRRTSGSTEGVSGKHCSAGAERAARRWCCQSPSASSRQSSTSSLMPSVLCVFSITALSVSLQARMLSPPPVSKRVNNSFSLLDGEGHNLSSGQGSDFFFPSFEGDICPGFYASSCSPSIALHHVPLQAYDCGDLLVTFLCKSFLSCRYPEAPFLSFWIASNPLITYGCSLGHTTLVFVGITAPTQIST